jgi:hypothetical protein
VRERHLFLPPEPGVIEEAPPTEGFASAMSLHRQMQEFNDL